MNDSENFPASSGNRCSIEPFVGEVFVSLVDYRNSLFTNGNPKKIIEFYDGFENREQLIQWMKERPKGVAYIREVEGDKDVIVVIPTADYNGKFAKECRENIFKGLHIIFVESGGRGDFYFNFAHYCNAGIKKAIEYNPKWIVVSNDDMIKVDDVNILRNALNNLDPSRIGMVFFSEGSSYHSVEMNISKIRRLRFLLSGLSIGFSKNYINILRKFSVKYVLSGNSIKERIFYRRIFSFVNSIAIAVYSGRLINETVSRDGYFYDEAFINCCEESDVAIRYQLKGCKIEYVDFKILPMIGSTLGLSSLSGLGRARFIRDQVGTIYLSSKLENEYDVENKAFRKAVNRGSKQCS
ncbi:MAG: hypothetical protein QXU98_10480 [Candidatus Parvarchaeota archaeon]